MEHSQPDTMCHNCGKNFRSAWDLKRHEAKKTPCLIRQVAEKDRENPLRCIYCNRVYSRKDHLLNHYNKCKIKNGGMNILAGKVIHEEIIRLRKIVSESENDKKRVKELEENQKFLQDQLMELKNQLTNTNINNTNNGTINNTTNIDKSKTINFNMNCFTQPDTRNIHISADEVAANDIPKLLMQKIYFDPQIPQNNSLYLLNKKENTLIVYETSDWRLIVGVDGIDQFVHRLSNVVIPKGADLINGCNGPYKGEEIKFTELPGAIQAKIQEFNGMRQSIDRNAVYEVFLTNRSLVANNIRSSGCKLLK